MPPEQHSPERQILRWNRPLNAQDEKRVKEQNEFIRNDASISPIHSQVEQLNALTGNASLARAFTDRYLPLHADVPNGLTPQQHAERWSSPEYSVNFYDAATAHLLIAEASRLEQEERKPVAQRRLEGAFVRLELARQIERVQQSVEALRKQNSPRLADAEQLLARMSRVAQWFQKNREPGATQVRSQVVQYLSQVNTDRPGPNGRPRLNLQGLTQAATTEALAREVYRLNPRMPLSTRGLNTVRVLLRELNRLRSVPGQAGPLLPQMVAILQFEGIPAQELFDDPTRVTVAQLQAAVFRQMEVLGFDVRALENEERQLTHWETSLLLGNITSFTLLRRLEATPGLTAATNDMRRLHTLSLMVWSDAERFIEFADRYQELVVKRRIELNPQNQNHPAHELLRQRRNAGEELRLQNTLRSLNAILPHLQFFYNFQYLIEDALPAEDRHVRQWDHLIDRKTQQLEAMRKTVAGLGGMPEELKKIQQSIATLEQELKQMRVTREQASGTTEAGQKAVKANEETRKKAQSAIREGLQQNGIVPEPDPVPGSVESMIRSARDLATAVIPPPRRNTTQAQGDALFKQQEENHKAVVEAQAVLLKLLPTLDTEQNRKAGVPRDQRGELIRAVNSVQWRVLLRLRYDLGSSTNPEVHPVGRIPGVREAAAEFMPEWLRKLAGPPAPPDPMRPNVRQTDIQSQLPAGMFYNLLGRDMEAAQRELANVRDITPQRAADLVQAYLNNVDVFRQSRRSSMRRSLRHVGVAGLRGLRPDADLASPLAPAQVISLFTMHPDGPATVNNAMREFLTKTDREHVDMAITDFRTFHERGIETYTQLMLDVALQLNEDGIYVEHVLQVITQAEMGLSRRLGAIQTGMAIASPYLGIPYLIAQGTGAIPRPSADQIKAIQEALKRIEEYRKPFQTAIETQRKESEQLQKLLKELQAARKILDERANAILTSEQTIEKRQKEDEEALKKARQGNMAPAALQALQKTQGDRMRPLVEGHTKLSESYLKSLGEFIAIGTRIESALDEGLDPRAGNVMAYSLQNVMMAQAPSFGLMMFEYGFVTLLGVGAVNPLIGAAFRSAGYGFQGNPLGLVPNSTARLLGGYLRNIVNGHAGPIHAAWDISTGFIGEVANDLRAGTFLRSGAAGVELGQTIRGPIQEFRTLMQLRQAGTLNPTQLKRLRELQQFCRSFLRTADQNTRIAFAAEVLNVRAASITRVQIEAIVQAHSIRPLGANGAYTSVQIMQKSRILTNAGFTQGQANSLIMSWVTGAGPSEGVAAGAQGAAHFSPLGRALGYGAHGASALLYGYGVYANSMEAADEHITVEQLRSNLIQILTKMGFTQVSRRPGTYQRGNVTIDVEDTISHSRRNAAIARAVFDGAGFAIEAAILAAGAAGGPVGLLISAGVAAVVLTVHVTADTLALRADYASIETAHPMILAMMGTGIVNRSAEDLLEHSFNDIFLAETSETVKQKLLYCIYVRELQKQGKFQELFSATQTLLLSREMLSGASANPSPVEVYQEIYDAFIANVIPLYKAQHLVSGVGFNRGFINRHGRLHTAGSNVARGLVPGGIQGPVNQIALWNEIIGDNADRRALVRSITARNLGNATVWHLEDATEQAYLNLLALSRRTNLSPQQAEQVQSLITMLGTQTVQGRRLADDREEIERNQANADGVAQSRSSLFLAQVRTAWNGLGDGDTAQSLRKAGRQPFRIDVSGIRGMSVTHLDLSTALTFGVERRQFMLAEFDALHDAQVPAAFRLGSTPLAPFTSPLTEPPPMFADHERDLRAGLDAIGKNRQELTKQYEDLRKAYLAWEGSPTRSPDTALLLSQGFSLLRQRLFLYADAVREYAQASATYLKETNELVKRNAENRNTVLGGSARRIQLWNADAYQTYAGEFPRNWERPPTVLTRDIARQGPAAARDSQMVMEFLSAADDRYGSNFGRNDVMSVMIQKIVAGQGTPDETATYMATYVLRNPSTGARSRLYTQTATWKTSESLPTLGIVAPAGEADMSIEGANSSPRHLAMEAFARRVNQIAAPLRVSTRSRIGGFRIELELPTVAPGAERHARSYFGTVFAGLGPVEIGRQGGSLIASLPLSAISEYGTILDNLEQRLINTEGSALLRRDLGRDQFVKGALLTLAHTLFDRSLPSLNRDLEEQLDKFAGSNAFAADVASVTQYIVKGLRARPQAELHLTPQGDLMIGQVTVLAGWQGALERDPMAAALQLARVSGRDALLATNVPNQLGSALTQFGRFYAYDQLPIPDFEAERKQSQEKTAKMTENQGRVISAWPADNATVTRVIEVTGETLRLELPAGEYHVETHALQSYDSPAVWTEGPRTSQSTVRDGFTWQESHNGQSNAGLIRVWRGSTRQGEPVARFFIMN